MQLLAGIQVGLSANFVAVITLFSSLGTLSEVNHTTGEPVLTAT